MVEFSSLSNPLLLFELCSVHFTGQLCLIGGLNKDDTMARWSYMIPKYIISKFDSLINFTKSGPVVIYMAVI